MWKNKKTFSTIANIQAYAEWDNFRFYLSWWNHSPHKRNKNSLKPRTEVLGRQVLWNGTEHSFEVADIKLCSDVALSKTPNIMTAGDNDYRYQKSECCGFFTVPHIWAREVVLPSCLPLSSGSEYLPNYHYCSETLSRRYHYGCKTVNILGNRWKLPNSPTMMTTWAGQ